MGTRRDDQVRCVRRRAPVLIRIAFVVIGAGLLAFAIWLAVDARSPSSRTIDSSASPSRKRSVDPAMSVRAPDAAPRRAPVESPPIDPVVARDLADPDPKIRLARIDQLAREGDDPATLLAATHDRDEAVSLLAMESLGRFYAQGRISLDELVDRYEDESLSAKARIAALETIGHVASIGGAQYLATLAKRGNVEERRAVATLLARQPREHAVPALTELARDSDEIVRQNATASLKTQTE